MGSRLSSHSEADPRTEEGVPRDGGGLEPRPSGDTGNETPSERAPLVCAKCLTMESWSRRVLLCGRCHFPYCTECVGAGFQRKQRRLQRGAREITEGLGLDVVDSHPLCPSCRSSLLRLPDVLLRYIMLFLPYRNQDRLLSVCTRFSSVVWVPYDYLKNLENLLQWREPFDVLHASPRSVVLRCAVRESGEVLAVKLLPKNRLLSRRLWQRMQDNLDIRIGCNFYEGIPSASTAPTAPSSPFPAVSRVFHNHDLVCIGCAFVDSAHFIPLVDCLQFASERSRSAHGSGAWSEATCLRILRKLLDAIGWMHDTLGAVHRNLSLETIHLDLSRGNTGDGYEVRILGFSTARFTTPRSKRPKFAVPATHGEGGPATGDTRTPTPGPGTSLPAAASASVVSNGAGSSTRKKTVRPLRLPPLSGWAVQRSATIYGRVAKEREAVLASGNAAQRFVKPASYTQQLLLSCDLDSDAGLRSGRTPGKVGSLCYAALASNEEGNRPTFPDDSDGEDTGLLVGTPRAAPGFAAPELLPALATKSIIPTTGVSAEDMQAWDVFAIGGVWYHLLSALVAERKRTELDHTVLGLPPLAPLEEVQSAVSAGSWELLLGLLHVDPRERWTCRQALHVTNEVLSTHSAAS